MKIFKLFLKRNLLLCLAILITGLSLFYQASWGQNLREYSDFKPFKMAFIPDIHMAFDLKDDLILYNESHVIFQDILKSFNKAGNIDFVVFGGDLTENKDNILTDTSMFLDTLDGLKLPYYVIFGDRDADLADDYAKEDFTVDFRKNGFRDKTQPYWALEPVNNVLLIGLDTTVKNRFSGFIPNEELLWLENTLKANKNKFTVITMHHPALITTNQDLEVPWNSYMLQNSQEFLNVIKKYPQVKIVLSGHHFVNSTKKYNNTLFISSPSIVSYPNKYKVLSVFPDRVEVENKKISFKQITAKAKKTIVNTEYAKQFDAVKPKKVIQFQEGDKFSNQKKYYFYEAAN